MTERDIHIAVVAWARRQAPAIPELALLYHVPNGEYRHPAVARRLKAMGTLAGIPDLFLSVARGRYHGLYIELKSAEGRVSDAQERMTGALRAQGYAVCLARTFDEATSTLLRYLSMEKIPSDGATPRFRTRRTYGVRIYRGVSARRRAAV